MIIPVIMGILKFLLVAAIMTVTIITNVIVFESNFLNINSLMKAAIMIYLTLTGSWFIGEIVKSLVYGDTNNKPE